MRTLLAYLKGFTLFGSLVAVTIVALDRTRFGTVPALPRNGFHAIMSPPPRTEDEKAATKAQWEALRVGRRLSESGDVQGALKSLEPVYRSMTTHQRAWSVVNNRIWSDALLRSGRFQTILDAYATLKGETSGEAPPAVTIADIELNGRRTLPTSVGWASVAKFLSGKDILQDLPSENDDTQLLALAYLEVGQDYHMEANFIASQWYFERASRLVPRSAFCAWELGRDLNDLGEHARARTVLRAAGTPKSLRLRFLLGSETKRM